MLFLIFVFLILKKQKKKGKWHKYTLFITVSFCLDLFNIILQDKTFFLFYCQFNLFMMVALNIYYYRPVNTGAKDSLKISFL